MNQRIRASAAGIRDRVVAGVAVIFRMKISAHTMARIHFWLTLFWLALSIPNYLWWKNSVEWVSWMSLYAIVATHWAAYQATRAEEHSEPAAPDEPA